MYQDQTERLCGILRWLLENPAVTEILSGMDSPTARDTDEVLERLEQQGYYEFILLLLARYQDDGATSRALADYLAERLAYFLRKNGPSGELAAFRAILAEQAARKKPAEG